MFDVQVHAGDFEKNKDHLFAGGAFHLRPPLVSAQGVKRTNRKHEAIAVDEIDTIEIATEENVQRLGSSVGWGAVGLALAGPIGLAAGALLGGRKKQVTFVCQFRDGRKFLGSTTAKTYTKITAAIMQSELRSAEPEEQEQENDPLLATQTHEIREAEPAPEARSSLKATAPTLHRALRIFVGAIAAFVVGTLLLSVLPTLSSLLVGLGNVLMIFGTGALLTSVIECALNRDLPWIVSTLIGGLLLALVGVAFG